MYVSFSSGLDDGRPMTAIGRIRAPTRWRAAGDPDAEADRQAAIEALTREAEDYGADAVVDVQFDVEGCKGCEIDGLRLERVIATGLAVRFARAA
jgi:Putative heavy-metal-binding